MKVIAINGSPRKGWGIMAIAALLATAACTAENGLRQRQDTNCRTENKRGEKTMIYDYSITTGKGEKLDLADLKGKVVLIVILSGSGMTCMSIRSFRARSGTRMTCLLPI